MRLRTLVVLGFGLGVIACDRTSAPDGAPATLIGANEIVSGSVSGDSVVYRVNDSGEQSFSVLLQPTTGVVTVRVLDRASEFTALTVSADGQPLGRHETLGIGIPLRNVRLVVSGNGSYRLQVAVSSPEPERLPSTIAFDQVVSGEDVAPARDEDVFTFRANAGDVVAAYAQTVDASGGGTLQVVLEDSTFSLCESSTVLSATADDLDDRMAFRCRIPRTGEYRLKVGESFSVGGAGQYVGAYRLRLRRVDPSPEHTPRVLVAGDTLAGEALDHVGDVDEFELSGTPGERYNVFLYSASQVAVTMQLPPTDAGVPPTALAAPGDTALLDQFTGVFLMPATGKVTARVTGGSDARGRGSYRLYAHHVDSRPEHHAIPIALGVPVTDAIDVPGDFDEYLFATSRRIRASVEVRITPGIAYAGIDARVLTSPGDPASFTNLHFDRQTGTAIATGLDIPAGTSVLQVTGLWDLENGFRGAYTVTLAETDDRPETGITRVAPGDTVDESIHAPGDVDVFELEVKQGDDVEIVTAGRDPSAPAGLGVGLVVERADGLRRLAFGGAQYADTTFTASTNRFTIPDGGAYVARFFGDSRGAYRFAVLSFPVAPEHHTTAIPLGSDVTDEAIDRLGDVDEFTLTGAPGTSVSLYFTKRSPEIGLPRAEAIDPATRAVLAQVSSAGAREGPAVFVIPAAGSVILRVAESRPDVELPYFYSGLYRLEVYPTPP